MRDICLKFHITDEEYEALRKQFGRLCWRAAHDLKRKNSRNNHTDDAEDIYQELTVAMLRAGSYYKRQLYIEKCLELAKEYARDAFMIQMVGSLEDLWKNRTRHGANRQKYGPFQERMLDRIVKKIVPKELQPKKNEPLQLDKKADKKFATYCKAIVWNGQKSMGKKITREKTIRSGMCSLSEYEYLAQSDIDKRYSRIYNTPQTIRLRCVIFEVVQ